MEYQPHPAPHQPIRRFGLRTTLIAAGMLVAVVSVDELIVLITTSWAPLHTLDLNTVHSLNRYAAHHSGQVRFFKIVSIVGGPTVLRIAAFRLVTTGAAHPLRRPMQQPGDVRIDRRARTGCAGEDPVRVRFDRPDLAVDPSAGWMSSHRWAVRGGTPASAAALINVTRSNTRGISTCRPGPWRTESGRQPCV